MTERLSLRPHVPSGLAWLSLWLLFTVFLGYYVVVELPELRLRVFKATVSLHLAAAALLAMYGLPMAWRRRLPRPTPLDVPLFLLLMAYSLSILTAVDRRLAWETALPVLLAFLLYYFATDTEALTMERLKLTLLGVGFILAARALVTVTQDYREWLASMQVLQGHLKPGLLLPPSVPRVHNIGDNPNVIATLFAMLLPLATASVLVERRLVLRLAALTAAGSIALALFFTLSRAAWLGAVAGLITTGLVFTVARRGCGSGPTNLTPFPSPMREGAPHRTAVGSWTRAAMLGIAALTVLATLLAVTVIVDKARPGWLFRRSFAQRLDAVQAGLAMWRDHPLTGVGPAGYALLYPQYSGRYPLLTVHAHNGYIQTGAELGLFGVLAVGSGGLFLLRRFTLALRYGDSRHRWLLTALIGGGIALLVQSVLDATFEFKSVPAVLAVLLALSVKATGLDGPAVHGFRRTALPSLVVLPLMVFLPGAWLYADRAHYDYSNGITAANARRWAAAADHLEAAVRRDPHYALYYFQAGLVEAIASESGRDSDRLQRALQYYRRGLDREPRSVVGWTNYARVLAWTGDREGARTALLRARSLASQDVAAQIVAGTILEELGFRDEAVDAYTQVLLLDSLRITAPFWEETAFRRENRRRIIEAVNQQNSLLAQANPAFDLSRSEPAPLTGVRTYLDPRLRRAQALLFEGAMDEAHALLQEALSSEPDKAEAHALLGDWYARRGELESAREAWFKAGYLGDSESLRKLGQLYDGGPVPPAIAGRQRRTLALSSQVVIFEGVQFYWIGIQYYRAIYHRASPHVILIPGAWEEVQPQFVRDAARTLAAWEGR